MKRFRYGLKFMLQCKFRLKFSPWIHYRLNLKFNNWFISTLLGFDMFKVIAPSRSTWASIEDDGQPKNDRYEPVAESIWVDKESPEDSLWFYVCTTRRRNIPWETSRKWPKWNVTQAISKHTEKKNHFTVNSKT